MKIHSIGIHADNQHLIDIWPGKYTRTHERAEELQEQTLKRESDLSHALECIRAERDELLAALDKIANREWQDETISWRSEAIDMQDEALAAIAKVEGRQIT
jgi:propanediol dehydratase small subunit